MVYGMTKKTYERNPRYEPVEEGDEDLSVKWKKVGLVVGGILLVIGAIIAVVVVATESSAPNYND